MKTLDKRTILINARALIADPSHWCQEHYAEDEIGCEDDVLSPAAVRFCALGALRRALDTPWGTPSDLYAACEEVLDFAVAEAEDSGDDYDYAPNGISEFNDTASHAAVLHIYDLAIAKTEAQP